MRCAGKSLGATAAVNYAVSGLVDWRLLFMLLAGGAAGGLLGTRLSHKVGLEGGTLHNIFATVIIVGLYMLSRTLLS